MRELANQEGGKKEKKEGTHGRQVSLSRRNSSGHLYIYGLFFFAFTFSSVRPWWVVSGGNPPWLRVGPFSHVASIDELAECGKEEPLWRCLASSIEHVCEFVWWKTLVAFSRLLFAPLVFFWSFFFFITKSFVYIYLFGWSSWQRILALPRAFPHALVLDLFTPQFIHCSMISGLFLVFFLVFFLLVSQNCSELLSIYLQALVELKKPLSQQDEVQYSFCFKYDRKRNPEFREES